MKKQERHWMEVSAEGGIPPEQWGRDHITTLLYAETRAVDHDGKLDSRQMRVDREYPTRLKNDVLVHGHTDYDCLTDAAAVGLLEEGDWESGDPVMFTDAGWAFVHGLRRSRAGTSERPVSWITFFPEEKPTKGYGPFYDRDEAKAHASTLSTDPNEGLVMSIEPPENKLLALLRDQRKVA